MGKPTVFIDGAEGTTGLQIHSRLNERDDIEIVSIPLEKRKDAQARSHFFRYQARPRPRVIARAAVFYTALPTSLGLSVTCASALFCAAHARQGLCGYAGAKRPVDGDLSRCAEYAAKADRSMVRCTAA